MKKPKQRQPEGGVDIFKKPEIPKKPRQPEGSGAPKKPIQRQPEGSGAPKKKKPIQRQPEGSGAPKKITGRGEFADTDRSKKTKTTKVSANKTKTKTSKPKVVTPKMIKDAGFTELRDYLNFKQGKTRRDGKKPVRVGDKKKVTNVVKPKLRPKNVVKKKTNGSKKVMVDSFKKSNVFKNKKPASKMGIDGGASQVNKTKKKIVKKNVMTTKTPKTFKGTNITPTKLQRQRMRKRMMGST